MTADQMPDEIYAVGSSVIVNGSGKTVLGMYSDTKPEEGATKYIRADLATPPKSQGVEVALEFKTEAEGEAYMHGYFDGENNLKRKDWFPCDLCGKRLPTMDGVEKHKRYCEKATRQHPTPAQAQGESVTVEELADKVRRVFSMWSDKDGEDSHDYVILKQCLEWATANGYTIIKRTE